MKVGKAIYNILSKSTDVQSNFPYNNTDYSPTGTELVENGEFDELGTDVITNGSFATDTDWTKGNGWSIAGKAISTQALGSEEVTNGDFSAAGINLVDNPNFTDTTNITIANYNFATGDMTGWNTSSSGDGVTPYYSNGGALISNGASGGQSSISQPSILEDTKSYKISYRIVSNGGGGLNLNGYGVFDSTVGSHSFYIVGLAAYTTFNIKRSGSNVNIVITDIVVEELGADWNDLGNPLDVATFDENGLTITSVNGDGIGNRVSQSNVVEAATSYKVTYTIHSANLTSNNTLRYFNGNSYIELPTAITGTPQTLYYTTASTITTAAWFFRLAITGGSTTDFVTISSISVQELGEDWTVTPTSPSTLSFNADGAFFNVVGGSFVQINQSLSFTAAKSYKLILTYTGDGQNKTFKLLDDSSSLGGIAENISTSSLTPITQTFYFTANTASDTVLFKRNSSGDYNFTINSVSVKEIATSYLTQAVSLSAKTWKIIYSVSDYIAGSVSATDYGAVTTANAVGITEYVQIGVASNFRMVNIDGYFEGAATDISAQLVDPNGYWTLGSGWTFGEDVAISDGSAGSITQSILTANTSYKITVKVTGNPTLLVFSSTSFYGDEATRTLKNGTHTYYLQAKAATFSITNEGGDACTVTNISVEEVVLNKIFPELAPPDIDAPYIVYSVVSNSPSETKNNNGDIDTASIEVYGFQDTYNKAVDLGVSVRAALDRKTGTYNTIEIQSTNYVNEQMDVNEARKLWAAIQDYSIRIKNL